MLTSTAVAFVSTLGPHGEPQVTPIWFMFDGEAVRFSLVEGRQKLRNLRRDPRIAVLLADPGCELERDVSIKYAGGWTDGEAAGTPRYAATVHVERTINQRGHGAA